MVRPLSRAASRTCARPGCPSPASATLRFRYDTREIHLDDLADQQEPESYDLCAGHTEGTGPPRGWSLEDRRSEPDGAVGPIGGEGTVALLAQMLGRDHDVPVADDGSATSDAPVTPAGPVADDGPVTDDDATTRHAVITDDAVRAGQPRLFDDDPQAEVRADAW